MKRKDSEGMSARAKELLTADEAAATLSVSKALLASLTAEGELPHVRLGEHQVRYPRAALREWVRSRTSWGDNQGGASRTKRPALAEPSEAAKEPTVEPNLDLADEDTDEEAGTTKKRGEPRT